MKITEYLADKLFSIAACLTAVIFTGWIFWMAEMRIEFIILAEIVFSAAFLVSFLWDFRRKEKYYKELWSLWDGLDDKTLFAELMKKPMFLDGKLVYQTIKSTDQFMNDRISEADAANHEYREYIEMWIHEVKTPITSARLIVENDKNETTLRIDNELSKIGHFVEQALFYARSTTLEKDFKLEKITLRELVQEALKSYSKQMIEVGGVPAFENLELSVFADRKWCVFIMEQIIANAVKYHKGSLRLSFRGGTYENGCFLLISDNGIGIAKADLPRIFDKGFTGENGRRGAQSTGIGLYLCRKLCEKMNMGISAESEQGKGTAIKLTFPKGNFYDLTFL
ncbi:MAG: sensor histidine kinase [Candidatus Gastranaerophilales bacterium]|nr:sensor histidine kinase [Candidatus Gastranaerophilales bacterium]